MKKEIKAKGKKQKQRKSKRRKMLTKKNVERKKREAKNIMQGFGINFILLCFNTFSDTLPT